MRYAIYFRETVIQRCHVNVHDQADVKAAIEAARLLYANGDGEERRDVDIDSSSAEIEIFAADEYDEATGRRLRSWELDGISGTPGEAVQIEP
jgi:hypothetical protein